MGYSYTRGRDRRETRGKRKNSLNRAMPGEHSIT